MRLLFITILIGLNSLLTFAGDKPEVVLTTGHNAQINAMVTSPNGRFLASAGNNKIIKIWEIATTQEYRTLSGTDGRVNEIIFSKDNIHLAGVSTQGELVVWNVITGEEVYRYDEGSSISKGITFSKDGKSLVHASKGGYLAVTNLETGIQKKSESISTCMAVDTNKQIVYSLDHLGNLEYFSLESESVVKTIKLFDEFNYPFSKMDVSPDGKYWACGFNDDVLRIYDTDLHKFVYESAKYNQKIKDLKFDPKKAYLYITIANGEAQILDYEKQKIINEFQSGIFSAQCLTAHPNGEIIILANNAEIQFYNVKRKKVFKTLESKVASIHSIAYDPTEQYMAVASDKIDIQIWDLKLNKVITTVKAFFPCEFSPDGKYLYAQQYNTNIGIYNVRTGQVEHEFNTNYQLQQAIAISSDGKWLASGGIGMSVSVWDLEKKKLKGTLSGHTGIITSLNFHPDGTKLVSTSYDQTSRVWDLNSMKEIQKFVDQTICSSDAVFSPDGKLLATASWDKTIKIRDTETWSIKHKLEGHLNMITTIDFNIDGTLLVSGASNNAVSKADNSVIVWDVASGTEKCKISDHQTGITTVLFDKTNDRIFSSSADGTIKINDHNACGVVATYVAIGKDDFMIYTPDNYYLASKNALRGVAFRINGELVPFEQFDVYLNRPDIVAKRIGKSPDQVIKAYNYLYKKRLRKLKINEGDLKIDYKIPHLINETNYDLVTSKPSLELWIKAWDDTYKIKQINIFVNDVPIFGEEGYQPTKEVKSLRKQFEIPLVEGTNKIQLSCVNSNGAESLLETIDVIRQGGEAKHDLYIVAVGVSDYQDDRFKLTYPTKDASDVVSKMQESSSRYNQVHTKLLLNQDATADNFNDLVSFFENCTHEDLAVIFIAGHGVLDENFDYYYGTYDMDFNQPREKGLAYDDIHLLLNKIKAYRKLLIMDTCHSGELDKEEIEMGPAPEIEEGDVQFRSAGASVRTKPGFGFENSLELTQDLFSDTRKGSGATVISSAGGVELAMESDEWKNGLFTYALLSGLSNPKLIGDRNNVITVTEIRSFVHKKVQELSQGKQIPSSREENISQDYIIFGH